MLCYDHLKIFDDVFLQCRYYGEYENDGIRGFILEYCDGINLYEKLVEDGAFSEQKVKDIMRYIFGLSRQFQHRPLTCFRFILSVLAKIHHVKLIHLDLRRVSLPVTASFPNANRAEI